MRSFLSCLVLASLAASSAFAAEPTPADAARVAVSIALAQKPPQAPVTPQAPAVTKCACGGEPLACTCDSGKCTCWPDGTACYWVQSKPTAASPVVSMLIISETPCPPCARLKAALNVAGTAEDYPLWNIFTDRADLVAKYNVTAFPTIILLGDGREIARRVGYASPAELRRWAGDPGKPVSRGACVEKGAYDVMAMDSSRSGSRAGAGSAGNALRPNMGGINYGAAFLNCQPMRYFSSGVFCPPGQA